MIKCCKCDLDIQKQGIFKNHISAKKHQKSPQKVKEEEENIIYGGLLERVD